MMGYLGTGEPVVNVLNVNKGITTLAIKINLNSSIKNTKNRTIGTLQIFQTFSKEYHKHNKQGKKLPDSYRDIFLYKRKETLLTKCHASRKLKKLNLAL